MSYSASAAATAAAVALGAAVVAPAAAVERASAGADPFVLSDCRLPGLDETVRCGTFLAPEDRARKGGRVLPLKVVVLPARAPVAGAGPVFYLSGGPGQAATDSVPGYAASAIRQAHDMVFLDLRGTGEGHRLDCAVGDDNEPQSYMEPLFSETEQFRKCRDELAPQADLTLYSTHVAMQDLEDLRVAMGYGQINLLGGSYGTRAAIIYLARHQATVRAAMLTALSPQTNRAPLHHAAAAQRAFDKVADQCLAEAPCAAAYGDIRGDLAAVRAALRARPAEVSLPHPVTGAPMSVRLSESGFGDGLRVMLYSAEGGRRIPLLLRRARDGDYVPFAQASLQSGMGIRKGLRLGLLLSVTCDEDVARIRPEEIARETGDSFTGDYRVRGQMAACAVWPDARVPAWYAAPFVSRVPTLLVSGDLDPVTPPQWGEETRKTLPNSIHVVQPGGHGEGQDCVDAMAAQLFRSGRLEDIDAGCVARLANPPFVLPDAAPAASSPAA